MTSALPPAIADAVALTVSRVERDFRTRYHESAAIPPSLLTEEDFKAAVRWLSADARQGGSDARDVDPAILLRASTAIVRIVSEWPDEHREAASAWELLVSPILDQPGDPDGEHWR